MLIQLKLQNVLHITYLGGRGRQVLPVLAHQRLVELPLPSEVLLGQRRGLGDALRAVDCVEGAQLLRKFKGLPVRAPAINVTKRLNSKWFNLPKNMA